MMFQVEKDVEASNTAECLWWMRELEQVGFQLRQEFIEREPECCFVQSCRKMVEQVDGDEQVKNSREQVPCNKTIGWIS